MVYILHLKHEVKMENKDINCTNFAQKVIMREDCDEETKAKLLQLIKDFETQYRSFNWNWL